MRRSICATLLLAALPAGLLAQTNVQDSCVQANLILVEAGIGLPQADLADRFGYHGLAGAGWQFKSDKNLLFGLSGHYYFGDRVKEDSLLFNLRDDNGYIIGNDGALFIPSIFEQGFDVMFHFGKITSLLSHNPNSGLTVMGGVGFFEHNIQIYIDEAYVPQLNDTYKKGYDRLTNGIMFSEYIGYSYFSGKHFVNFRAGLEWSQAITKGRRGITFDTLEPQDATRLDMMINLKLTWVLPVYKQTGRSFYY